jgi:phage replication O-like protein O
MASPQKENGSVMVANELLGALIKAKLNGVEWRVIMTVIRKTYGFNKKFDRISFTQFQEHTDSCRSVINKAIKSLVAKRILVANKLPLGNEYGLNKDYDSWVVAKKILVAKIDQTSSQLASRVVANRSHTKDTITKYKQKTIKGKLFFECLECHETSDIKGKHKSYCKFN